MPDFLTESVGSVDSDESSLRAKIMLTIKSNNDNNDNDSSNSFIFLLSIQYNLKFSTLFIYQINHAEFKFPKFK